MRWQLFSKCHVLWYFWEHLVICFPKLLILPCQLVRWNTVVVWVRGYPVPTIIRWIPSAAFNNFNYLFFMITYCKMYFYVKYGTQSKLCCFQTCWSFRSISTFFQRIWIQWPPFSSWCYFFQYLNRLKCHWMVYSVNLSQRNAIHRRHQYRNQVFG